MTDKQALFEYALRLGDDALLLGHRLSEWCSNGPWLEEDLAVSNVALDYIGRARQLYSYAAKVENQGRTEDDLAYLRSEREYRNLLIHELPRGNFAESVTRQFLVDVYNIEFFEKLSQSKDSTLSEIAGKSVVECQYHLRRDQRWMLTLGDGTEESHNKMQQALNDIWIYTDELFAPNELDLRMAESGIGVEISALKPAWSKLVNPVLEQATLVIPSDVWPVTGGRSGLHTEHLGHLLAEMQYMQRSYPGLQW
jgi:ring-1,2-phenylacetyl-CoA epoxidase subunit PaaC